ncbi:MAG: 50S ribosomal protein L2, partial [bacterium]|nr:50S ribosomal protein L2 [bacterium]
MAKTSRKKPEKGLLTHVAKRGGRASSGRITAWHRGGGARKLWRQVEFGQGHFDVLGKVLAIEYDPNRNAHLALVEYERGERAYILAPHELEVGSQVVTKDEAEIKTGNRMKLASIPVGTMVHNVELEPGRGGRLARGAGASVIVLAHDAGYTQLQMPSSEIRRVPSGAFASVGTVSNPEFRYKNA